MVFTIAELLPSKNSKLSLISLHHTPGPSIKKDEILFNCSCQLLIRPVRNDFGMHVLVSIDLNMLAALDIRLAYDMFCTSLFSSALPVASKVYLV